jgi:hypothetical protein
MVGSPAIVRLLTAWVRSWPCPWRVDLDLLLGHVLLDDVELDAAVLFLALFRGVVRDRFLFAVAFGD